MVQAHAPRWQRTISQPAEVRGIGFLTGADVRIRFLPAPVDTGIVFVRDDLPDRPSVPARIDHVVPRQRRTTIQRGAAVVEMVEHVMASLSGSQIDNCLVEINASETPGCDGSSQAFTEALWGAEIVEQDLPRKRLRIERPITVTEGNACISALPADHEALTISYSLDYGPESPIARQSRTVDVTPDAFRDHLSPSRTFLLEKEAQTLRQSGVGARTTVSDLLIFGQDGPIGNTLRFADEPVRHKMLDLVGDLALLGQDLVGQVIAHRSGHQLNAELARKLLTNASSSAAAMDIGDIMRMLPHRYPFLLVDRVIGIEPTKKISAIKNVSINEPFFQGHWPQRPVMPGVLILEALAQSAGLLLANENRYQGKTAVFASIDKAKFRAPVAPGDQLELEVTLTRSRDRAVEFHGVAKANGQIAAEAVLRLVLTDGNG